MKKAPRGARDHLIDEMASPKCEARFWSRVQGGDVETCWVWTGARTSGYGTFYVGQIERWTFLMAAHRWAYLRLRGEVGSLALDHLCRNRACVNPWHLEPVTNQVNSARGAWGMRTHCPQGHPYDDENTSRRPQRRSRECITCRREARRRRRRQQRALLAADPSIVEHGTLDTYNDWLCRCRPCKDAQAAYRRERRAAGKS